uniref:Uncharacterized protein n=1 Tax=Rhizophora mucronata TaxID=61149 RepID=A0A2P2P075_RHIMU
MNLDTHNFINLEQRISISTLQMLLCKFFKEPTKLT